MTDAYELQFEQQHEAIRREYCDKIVPKIDGVFSQVKSLLASQEAWLELRKLSATQLYGELLHKAVFQSTLKPHKHRGRAYAKSGRLCFKLFCSGRISIEVETDFDEPKIIIQPLTLDTVDTESALIDSVLHAAFQLYLIYCRKQFDISA